MSRASKTITLVLMGSAAGLFGYNALHRTPVASEEERAEGGDFDGSESFDDDGDGTTRPAGSSRSYHSTGSHHSVWSGSTGGSSGDYRRSSSSGSGGSSSPSAGQGSHTSRGGFGSTGHASAGS